MITVPAPTSIVPVLLRLSTMTVKAGTRNFDKQIGTGPFKLESYSNGNARLVRNDAWHLGAPLLDAVEITRFDSVGALSNAVLSGQVDLASNVGAIAGRSAEGREDVQVVRRPDDVVVPIVMRTSDGPFTDPRVREAIELGPTEKHSSPRRCRGWARCPTTSSARATRTLTPAFRSGSATSSAPSPCRRKRTSTPRKTYELITKEEAAGEVESAKAFAVQMRDIGLNIEAVRQESNEFYESTWCLAPSTPRAGVRTTPSSTWRAST